MKKATKSIFILIILGAFALTGGGCGKEEEDEVVLEMIEVDDEFDFSMYMRIDERFDEVDWSGFEAIETNWLGFGPGVRLKGIDEHSELFVDEENLRVSGTYVGDGAYLRAMLNDEAIPHGDPMWYDYLRYGTEMDTVEIGYAHFFVDLVLKEGTNIVKFIVIQESTEEMVIKVININYNPKN